jgi:ethanolamine transporter EutH
MAGGHQVSFIAGMLVGLLVGGPLGILTTALLITAAASDREAKRMLNDLDHAGKE